MRIYGKNPVLERLKSNPKTIKMIYLQSGHEETGYVFQKAKKWGIPVCQVPATKLQKLARDVNTQGMLMEVENFSYCSYDEILEDAKNQNRTLVFLDNLTDPQNLGGIIRSLACLGGFSIILPTHHSVEVTDSVLRVACGGENYLKVCKVANLVPAILEAKQEGITIMGSVVKGGQDITQVDLPFPCGIVIGSEAKGVRDVVQKHIDLAVTIPMAAERLSMNAAHATTLLCYEIMRQKKQRTQN